jgi:uncharacterized OB-fold protein
VKQTPTHAVAPEPTPDSEEFWSACNEGRLLLRQCTTCEHTFHYPRVACPRCAQRQLRWIDASGRGTLYAHTTVYTSFYGSGWENDIPYTVLLVDLDEGPRMLSRLVGDDDGLVAGVAVEVEFYGIGEQRYPYFKLESKASQ